MPDDGGNVINVSSIASENYMPTASVYSATKAALDAVTRVLSRELAARKVRVNTLAPGMTDTEGTAQAGIKGSDFEATMVAQTPLGRLGQPDDIARVAVFLASEASGWLIGERIAAAGGLRSELPVHSRRACSMLPGTAMAHGSICTGPGGSHDTKRSGRDDSLSRVPRASSI